MHNLGYIKYFIIFHHNNNNNKNPRIKTNKNYSHYRMIKELEKSLFNLISTIDRITKSIERMESGPLTLCRELKDSIVHYREVIKALAIQLYPWAKVYTKDGTDDILTLQEQRSLTSKIVLCERNSSNYGRMLREKYELLQKMDIREQLKMTSIRLLNVSIGDGTRSNNHFDD